jgi:hypothetical protein
MRVARRERAAIPNTNRALSQFIPHPEIKRGSSVSFGDPHSEHKIANKYPEIADFL